MKDFDFRGLISSVKEASPSHLALFSLIIFPIILNFWVKTIKNLHIEISLLWKVILILVLLLLFIGCIFWITIENQRKNKLRLLKDKIITRLVANNWKSMSFESARKVLGKTCNDEMIVSVIEEFPTILRHVRIKDKDDNNNHKKDSNGKPIYKAGVGRINEIDN